MLNIACVGAGYWGKNLIRNFHELGVLKVICDDNINLLRSFSKQYPDAASYSSFSQVLTDNSIHAVSISTPVVTHNLLIQQALKAGKHVFVEKPLCLDENQAVECIELADSFKLTLMVGHLLWYHPAVLEIRRALHAGELGKIHYLYSNRLNMGLLRDGENVLWSFASHDISIILGLVDSKPVAVKAFATEHLQTGIADQVIGILAFENKISAHIHVSWLNPFKEQKLVIVGEKAMLVFDDTLPWEQKLAKYCHSVHWENQRPVAVKSDPQYIELTPAEPLKSECQHFIDSIVSGSRPRTDGREGLKVLKVLNQLQQAIDS